MAGWAEAFLPDLQPRTWKTPDGGSKPHTSSLFLGKVDNPGEAALAPSGSPLIDGCAPSQLERRGTAAINEPNRHVSARLSTLALSEEVKRDDTISLDDTGFGGEARVDMFIEANLVLLADDKADCLPILFGADALVDGGPVEDLLEHRADFADLGDRLEPQEGTLDGISILTALIFGMISPWASNH